MKKQQYRFIRLVGSGYEVKFVRGKPIKRNGKELLEVGIFKKKYYPFRSELSDYDENGEIVPEHISEGLKLDVPIEVLVWNEQMKQWAISEHTKPSWFTEWKPLIFTFGFALLVVGGMLIVGSKFDAVTNSTYMWLDKMDKFVGAI